MTAVPDRSSAPAPGRVRAASLDDLDALVALEEHCFNGDRLSRRSFRRLLTRSHATVLVHQSGDDLDGYGIVLFHAGTALSRLYSLAVHPHRRGRGIAQRLIAALEGAAAGEGCVAMRLEVRRDNTAAQQLYERAGYRIFGAIADYYEDHEDAVRMERTLEPEGARPPPPAVHYEQTLDFTCGPAALMMGMRRLDPKLPLDRRLELEIWREATTIYMTSGHGGCGPEGLALAACRRGFGTEVWLKDDTDLFTRGVRSAQKKEVIALVQAHFREQLTAAKVPLIYGAITVADLRARLALGEVPLVLISSYRLYGDRAPHWVVVAGAEGDLVWLDDPYVDREHNRTPLDSINVPIARDEFMGMARYGRSGQRAAVILRRGEVS